MGYREYIYEVDAELVEKIRACTTNEEFVELCKSISACCNDIEDGYIPVYRLGRELFEFGKYYENSDKMYEHGDSLFASEELRERYKDYNAIVIDKSGLLCAIEWQRKRVMSIYEDLLKEKSELNEYDDRPQLERLKEHARDHLRWWKYGGCDTEETRERLAASWLYEHTIFDLVRIYKTFDWEHKRMLFFGW